MMEDNSVPKNSIYGPPECWKTSNRWIVPNKISAEMKETTGIDR